MNQWANPKQSKCESTMISLQLTEHACSIVSYRKQ